VGDVGAELALDVGEPERGVLDATKPGGTPPGFVAVSRASRARTRRPVGGPATARSTSGAGSAIGSDAASDAEPGRAYIGPT